MFIYLPGVDWLLLNVTPVADWLFMAVVEKAAEKKDQINIKYAYILYALRGVGDYCAFQNYQT